MTLAKTEGDWNILIGEYSVCKKKLQSKNEALQILVKDLDQCQVERDIYKNKICQLQQEVDELKGFIGGHCKGKKQNSVRFGQEEDRNKKIKVLKQLIERVREENLALHNDIKSVKELYVNSQNDNQLLREAISKHELQQKAATLQSHDKSRLIDQLEDSQNKIDDLQREIQSINDEQTEITQERDYFKEKSNRLNTELNYVLYNDEKRIVDVDALILENKYLKEVMKQYKEEKLLAIATSLRYKEALEQGKEKSSKFLAYLDLPNNFKSCGKQGDKASKPQHSHRFGSNSETVTELQRVAKSLTEMLSEKDIALKHQRNTNRILGTRVKELEKKLKTLEISGLWSLQGNGGSRSRRSELQSDEHVNEMNYQKYPMNKTEDLDNDEKSPILGSLTEDEATKNGVTDVKEGLLLDIDAKDSVVSVLDSGSSQPSDFVEVFALPDISSDTQNVIVENETEHPIAETSRKSSSCPETPIKHS